MHHVPHTYEGGMSPVDTLWEMCYGRRLLGNIYIADVFMSVCAYMREICRRYLTVDILLAPVNEPSPTYASDTLHVCVMYGSVMIHV